MRFKKTLLTSLQLIEIYNAKISLEGHSGDIFCAYYFTFRFLDTFLKMMDFSAILYPSKEQEKMVNNSNEPIIKKLVDCYILFCRLKIVYRLDDTNNLCRRLDVLDNLVHTLVRHR